MAGPNLSFACCLFCAAVPLAAQAPAFVDGAAFGGTRLFTEEFIPSMSMRIGPQRSFYALGFAQGDQGAGQFISSLDSLASGDLSKINDAISELKDSPWGLRSRAFGLALYENGATLSFTRAEMTSLWAEALDGETVGFDVRRSVIDKVSLTAAGSPASGGWFYGGTFRIEKWSHGSEYSELRALSNLSEAKSLLDYKETADSNVTYAVDAFTGFEIAGTLRFIAHSDRLVARHFGDIEEKTQLRAGVQIDLGSMAQIGLESDLNEAMRVPFPIMRRAQAASLKVRANTLITFAIGVERVTMGGEQTTRTGLNAWITGKKYRLGVGFQFGQDKAPRGPWGATWRGQ